MLTGVSGDHQVRSAVPTVVRCSDVASLGRLVCRHTRRLEYSLVLFQAGRFVIILMRVYHNRLMFLLLYGIGCSICTTSKTSKFTGSSSNISKYGGLGFVVVVPVVFVSILATVPPIKARLVLHPAECLGYYTLPCIFSLFCTPRTTEVTQAGATGAFFVFSFPFFPRLPPHAPKPIK